MLHQSRLIPAQALSVRGTLPHAIPDDIRGTRQAIFFLLRRTAVQPGQTGQPTPSPTRAHRAHAAPATDADNFVFQF